MQQSQDKSLAPLDAPEVQLNGTATLVLTFSTPLTPEQDFSRIVYTVDEKSGKVDGVWELVPGLKELRLHHLEPNWELAMTIERNLLALDKAAFAIDYGESITIRDI